MIVRFGDVVVRANTKEDKNNTEKEFYLDGQFFEGEELEVLKGSPLKGATIGPMFYFGFKAGQVLFMSRSFAIKKAAVARFDGICSEKTFVLETKDNNVLLQEYLVFILQNQAFWDYCEEDKSGSVNFFINWSTLEKYEFDLPTIEEQRRISDLLWAAYEVKKSYRKMISSIDEMVKSQFIEKIGDTRTNPKGWDVYTLKELVVPSCPISYGIVQPGDDIEEGGVPIVRPVDLDETHRVTAKGLKRTTKEISDAYKRTILEGNELLLCVRGTTGLVGLATDELKGCNVTRGITPLSFNEKADRVFMLCTFLSDGIQEFISDNTIGSALRGINMAVIREMKIPTPPVHVQKSFADLYIQADKSKFELKQAIEKIDKVMRALMQ